MAPGIDVCLTCFNAGCDSPDRKHAQVHYQKTNHPLVLNIYRLLKDKPKRVSLFGTFSVIRDTTDIVLIYRQMQLKNHLKKLVSSRLYRNLTKTNMNLLRK